MGIVNLRGHYAFVRRQGLKYRSIFAYEAISGWLSEREAITLFDLAQSVRNDRPVVVEIGSWVGKSSIIIGKGLKGKTDPTLYCIDPFNGDADDADRPLYAREAGTLPKTLKEVFLENMRNNGVLDVVRPLEGYSFAFAPDFNEPIDFLLIDGNHDYEAVLQDYEQWSPKVRPGGVIAFHDVVFGDDPDPAGPGMVAEKHIFANPRWTDVKVVDNLLVARKAVN